MSSQFQQNAATYWIPVSNIDRLKARLALLANQARVLSAQSVTFVELGEEMRKLPATEVDQSLLYKPTRKVHCVQIRVTGDAPILDGWEFLAYIKHAKNTVSPSPKIYTAPGKVVPPKYLEALTTNCGHCNMRPGTRRHLYIVRNVKTGKTVQVGRSCVRDFLGHSDPRHVLGYFNMMEKLTTVFEEEDNERTQPQDWYYPAKKVLEHAVYFVETNGYASRRGSFHDVLPTADEVENELKRIVCNNPEGMPVITEEQKEKARMVMEWVDAIVPNGNQYLHNVKAAFFKGYVSPRHLGVAVSAVPAYYEEETKTVGGGHSKHVGQVGQKITVYGVKLLKNKECSGRWVTFLHSFITDDGNLLVWWASKSSKMQVGKCYDLKMTVKSHDFYKGEATTKVIRVSPL